jgi:hypothetical protein
MKGPSLLNQRLGTTHGGTGEARGAGGWVPDPPGHAKPGYALENESPAGRSAGGCQVVGAPPPPRRSWVATGPKPKPGGLLGPWESHGGRRGARVTTSGVIICRELQQAFAALRASSVCAVGIFGISTKVGRWGDRVSVPRRQSQTTVLEGKNQVTCTWCFGVRIAVLGACCASRS